MDMGDENATNISDIMQQHERPMPQNSKGFDMPSVAAPDYNELKTRALNEGPGAHPVQNLQHGFTGMAPPDAMADMEAEQQYQQQQQQQQMQPVYYEDRGFWAHNKFAILVATIIFALLAIAVPKLLTYNTRLFSGTDRYYLSAVIACLGAYAYQTLSPYI